MKSIRLPGALVLLGALAAAASVPAMSAVAPATVGEAAFPTVEPAQVIPATVVNPVYPEAERKAGVEGSVLLAGEIGADGKVTGLKPEQEVAGHPAFTEAALTAVRQWRFTPARESGKAVASSVRIPVKFKLDCEGKDRK